MSSTASISDTVTNGGVFSLSKRRWIIICIYGFMNMANSQMWVSFSPISDLTTDFFDHTIGKTGTNMLALVFSIFYLPGSVISGLLIKRYDIRIALLISGLLTTAGSLFRVLGIGLKDQLGATLAYSVTLLGQVLASLAQPFFMNIPAALTSTWFDISERDVATAIASMCNPLGTAVGQLLPPFLVHKSGGVDDDDENASVSGMFLFMIVQSSWAIVALTISYFFFDAAPEHPPSPSTLFRKDGDTIIPERSTRISRAATIDKNVKSFIDILKLHDDSGSLQEDLLSSKMRQSSISQLPCEGSGRENSIATKGAIERDDSIIRGDCDDMKSSYNTLKGEIRDLFAVRDYLILFFAISLGLGIFNTLIALLNQLVEGVGYSNDDAGNFGALIVGCGIIFAGVTGYILDTTHLYKESLKVCFVGGCLSLLLWLSSIYHDNGAVLCIASAVMGAFVVPLIPIVIECTAEVTYPISEDISVGVLLTGGNYVGVVLTLLVQWLIDRPALGPPPFLPSSMFLFIALCLSTIAVLFFEGDYKRLKVDQSSTLNSS